MSVTDEIKARIDIVELVGNTVQLKKSGRNYKGLCPFHNEKTPSFVVFPDSQNWRCFGACGEGGDIFTFVMKREGWDFPEARRYLAEMAGIELEPFTPQQAQVQEAHDRLRSLLSDAARFFTHRLLQSPDAEYARQYIAGRGLSAETIEVFGVGYAPNSWDATSHYLLDLGYSTQEIIDAGLVVVRDDGNTYDRFRNRLTISIRDMRGGMVGFGARALDPEATPKYINSPQSALFDKSRLLFGLDRARRTIREMETAVIVEGYMDVMQAHQAGFTDVVAEMGTALTALQLRLLARYASSLILALDPDTAGQMATDRGREVIERVSKAAAEEAAQEGMWGFDTAEREYRASLATEFDVHGMLRYESRLGFDIRVLILPEGKDPDDLIREDPQAWANLVAGAVPIVEYVIQKTLAGQNLDDPKTKSRIVDQVNPLIDDIANPVERSHYRQRLARLLRIDERALLPEGKVAVRRSRSPGAAGQPPPAAGIVASELTQTPTLWREAFSLAALIQHPRLIYRVNRVLAEYLSPGETNLEMAALDSLAGEIVVGDFAHPEHRMIFEAWQIALEQDEIDPLSYLYQTLDEVTQSRLQTWIEQPLYALERQSAPPSIELHPDRVSEAVIQALLDLRRKRLEEHIGELRFLIEDSENGGEPSTARQYGETIRLLIAALSNIEQARRRYSLSGKREQQTAHLPMHAS
ncbi:MAG: DNA primase [Anaerolineae bacterium]|nr:DNA primase [Anaerolineae bacterium]